MITKKTSAIAILYKEKCLVDKSKTDAVTMYLKYQIKQSQIENRLEEVFQLKKDLCLVVTLLIQYGSIFDIWSELCDCFGFKELRCLLSHV